jgi:hypothetical protein
VAKGYIFDKTGMMPDMYDPETHFVTAEKLTLEILKEISDNDEVIEVAGEYLIALLHLGQCMNVTFWEFIYREQIKDRYFYGD